MATVILLGFLLLPFLLVGGGVAFFWKSRRRAILRWTGISYLLGALVIVFVVGPYFMAWWIVTKGGTRPQDLVGSDTPADHEVRYEEVLFQTADRLKLSGWFIPPAEKNAIIIFTHGLFRNRTEMLSRGLAVRDAGYGALLYDSRSHGSSDRALVSLGYHERNDVLAAIGYLQRRYQDALERPRLVLMGVSMGAVATLQAAATCKDYSAIILDSPFLTLRETIEDHSWLLFKLPPGSFAPVFLFWFQRRTGIHADQLNSLLAVQKIQPVPLLIIGSEGDVRIKPQVARTLYGAAASPDRFLKMFGKEVRHGAAARLRPEEYSRVMVEFLDRALAERPEPSATWTNEKARSPR